MENSENLNFLRSWAVLAVVVGHLLCYFSNSVYFNFYEPCLIASYGVAIFFVHTFLVLMMSLERQYDQYGPDHFFSVFMIRRIFRIYPLSILLVILTVAFNVPVLQFEKYHFIGADISLGKTLANLFLVQNFVKNFEVIGPLWSLPYEIQMYLALPFIFLITRNLKSIIPAFVVWASFCYFGNVLTPKLVKLNESLDFFIVPALLKWMPCFLSGVLAYFMCQRKPPRTLPFWLLPLFLVLSTFAYPVSYSVDKNYYFTLIIGLLLPLVREVQFRPLIYICNRIAKYSYGIYLFHFPSMWVAFEILGQQSIYLRIVVFLLIIILAPMVTFHLLEDPFIELGRKIPKHLYATLGVSRYP